MAEEKDQTPTRVRKTPYKSQYPYNKVEVTESGHEFHTDDTPGHERIRVGHRKGTYDEMHPDGSRTNYTVGHEQTYVKGGATRTVDENEDTKIEGHKRELVHGGHAMEVGGDIEITCGGDHRIVALGDGKFAISGVLYIGVKGNANINVMGSTDIKSAGDITVTAPNMIVKANMEVEGEVKMDKNLHVKKDISNEGNMKTDGVHTDANGVHG